MSDIKTITLNLLNNQKYDYGTTPNQAIAEQNQTYFAYFDTLADTSPMLKDHTAYYIKYLIDTEGNVVNPEPDSNPNRPQAIGLYNLLNNFEPNKNAIIKTITNDPLYSIPPNSYMLNGSYPIKHVGRLTPIMTTTTGSGINDYVRTMSFEDLLGNPLSQNFFTPNLYFQRYNQASDFQIGSTFENINFNGTWVDAAPSTWDFDYAEPFTFIYPGGTADAGTRVKIKVTLSLRTNPSVPPQDRVDIRVKFLKYIALSGDVISLGEVTSTEIPTSYTYIPFESDFFDLAQNDRIWIQARREGGSGIAILQCIGETGDGNGSSGTVFEVLQQVPANTGLLDGVSVATSSYWIVDPSNYEPSPGISILTGSQGLTNLYTTENIIQTTPTASIEIGYPIISTPFNPILPGDKIKFTLGETDVHTIIGVDIGSNLNGFPALFLTITPPVDSNTILNNFTIYRIINDGTSVILDVKKDISGSAYSGVIQPQFVSKELIDNYDKIIINLTEREIIN